MANLINLDRVSKRYDAAGVLLDEVSLGLDDGDRVGVVGLNGAGKTTLLRLLTRADQPDAGRVTHRRDLRVAALPQTLDLDPAATVGGVVVGTAWLGSGFTAEHEWAGDAGVRTVLTGLGLPGLGLDTPVGPLSGGERRRVALAALLVREADVLVLDEPTNHLDVSGVDWLARHLLTRRGALVVVTHDRWFLDTVCTRTWEVADRAVRAYDGGYAAWTLARAERERQAAATEARRQNLLRKEIAWLRRGPKARTSKPKFRLDAADALIADVPPPRDAVSLRRLATARLGKQVYDVEGVTLRAGPVLVLDDVTWRVGPGDRVAIVGANGVGKTTLLRLLAGELTPERGSLRVGRTVRPGYLSQELAEIPAASLASLDRADATLPTSLRVLEAVEEVARRVTMGDRDLTAAQLAEIFGFRGDRLWTPVVDLSGGERRRLQLLRLLATEPNVLLLDEPTNDLDIDTLAALEDLLDTWPGTLVVASHDRYLVERVTDGVYGMFGDGRLVHLPGGVDDYLTGTAAPAPRSDRELRQTTARVLGAPTHDGPGRPAAGDARAARKELARLERQVSRLEQREATLHEQLAIHATDYAKLSELDADLQEVRAERARVEEAWLALADQLPDT
jgi:ATPase subunit of ABC transporter with duplicated ATPase domains